MLEGLAKRLTKRRPALVRANKMATKKTIASPIRPTNQEATNRTNRINAGVAAHTTRLTGFRYSAISATGRSGETWQAIARAVLWRRDDEPSGSIRLSLISLFVFAAWLVSARGWVRAVAVVWLIYPVTVYVVRRSRRG